MPQCLNYPDNACKADIKLAAFIKNKEKCDCNATNIFVSIYIYIYIYIKLNKKQTLIIYEAEDLLVLSTSHKTFQYYSGTVNIIP
jgi:hypothetical protein